MALIPHTTKHTTLADRSIGERLNIEVDFMGKYIERLLGPYRSGNKTGISISSNFSNEANE